MAEYVRREEAIDDFEQCNAKNPKWEPQRVKTLLLRVPAADVAPVVHAQWEKTALVEVDSHGEIYRIPNAGLRCPWCMCAFDKTLLWRRSYCPNCGAKMDGGTT